MIQFTITEQQADQILNALAQRPFIEVQGLISALMAQAQEQQQAGKQDGLPTHAAMPPAQAINGHASA